MKLAEALILRADTQKRIEQLKERLLRNAKVQQGTQPAEKPEVLLTEFEKLSQELLILIQKINRTNSATQFAKGSTLSDALAERELLAQKQGMYRDLAKAGTITQERYSKSEVKFISAVKVSEMQKRADKLAREHRHWDTIIQEINWKIDLVE